MIFATADSLRERAERVAGQLGPLQPQVRPSSSPIGGGSTPDQALPTWVVELHVPKPNAFEAKLRAATIPVIARIEANRVVLDMRTVANEEEKALVEGVLAAASELVPGAEDH